MSLQNYTPSLREDLTTKPITSLSVEELNAEIVKLKQNREYYDFFLRKTSDNLSVLFKELKAKQ